MTKPPASWCGRASSDLRGTVTDLAQKELTGFYAGMITGIKTVNNNLVVTESPPPRSHRPEHIDDGSITAQIKPALRIDPSTTDMTLGVTTKNGSVTLNGEVESLLSQTLVSQLVRTVRGVVSVNNATEVTG
ncbi:MAG: BON domain-containing protein [Candidatus Synoicihabitans palmerolidicus]|nr:BON domain-containing protein [Candidatus Synoicihabitans palmerolidicus]